MSEKIKKMLAEIPGGWTKHAEQILLSMPEDAAESLIENIQERFIPNEDGSMPSLAQIRESTGGLTENEKKFLFTYIDRLENDLRVVLKTLQRKIERKEVRLV